jgi:DNA topoisomerase-3
MTRGDYTRDQFSDEMRRYVEEIVNAVRNHDGGNEEIFARDHGPGDPIKCPRCGAPLAEKTFSFMCAKCELNISKDQSGKYVFPETLRRLLRDKRIGPMTGFERTRASGFLKLNDAFEVEVELTPSSEPDAGELDSGDKETRYETVPEGAVMGKCPKCKGRGVASDVVRSGMGYKCVLNVARAKEKECDFRLAEKIRYRFLPPDQIRKLMAGEKTDYLFGFISRNGKRFQASLHYSPEGELQWEFPPRAPKKGKKKAEGEEAEGGEAASGDAKPEAKPEGEAAEKKPSPRRRSGRKPTPKT